MAGGGHRESITSPYGLLWGYVSYSVPTDMFGFKSPSLDSLTLCVFHPFCIYDVITAKLNPTKEGGRRAEIHVSSLPNVDDAEWLLPGLDNSLTANRLQVGRGREILASSTIRCMIKCVDVMSYRSGIRHSMRP